MKNRSFYPNMVKKNYFSEFYFLNSSLLAIQIRMQNNFSRKNFLHYFFRQSSKVHFYLADFVQLKLSNTNIVYKPTNLCSTSFPCTNLSEATISGSTFSQAKFEKNTKKSKMTPLEGEKNIFFRILFFVSRSINVI